MVASSVQCTLIVTNDGEVYESKELEGFVKLGLENITQVACGHDFNGAIDRQGNLFTWQPNQDAEPRVVRGHGLVDICVGATELGLVRDRSNYVYEWGVDQPLRKLKKKAHIIC